MCYVVLFPGRTQGMSFPQPKPQAPQLPRHLLRTIDCNQGAVRAVRFNGEDRATLVLYCSCFRSNITRVHYMFTTHSRLLKCANIGVVVDVVVLKMLQSKSIQF